MCPLLKRPKRMVIEAFSHRPLLTDLDLPLHLVFVYFHTSNMILGRILGFLGKRKFIDS